MNKTIYYIVGGIVVVGGAVAFMINKPASPSGPGGDANMPARAAQMSMKDLLGLGGAQRCTFTNKVENSESSGVVYVANGKMRGDFTSLSAGQTVKSHMIVDGETSYVWSDAMPQGMKMSFANIGASATGQNANQSVDVNKKVDYSCGAWTVDVHMFALPDGVTFSDLSAMLPPVGTTPVKGGTYGDYVPGSAGSGDLKATQCASCDQIPDADAKMQCLETLGCTK
ncbi:MAG: hypothetical protein RL681_551 [Candidatus Parcubacteria bacterium]|jgi:hypothetical protein